MKKLEVLILVVIFAIVLITPNVKTYDDGYSDGYNDGYKSGKTDGYEDGLDTGYECGYDEGVSAAKRSIAIQLDYDLESIAYDIREEYSMTPMEAVWLLSSYADSTEYVTKSELCEAIWIIESYFCESQSLTGKIKGYSID